MTHGGVMAEGLLIATIAAYVCVAWQHRALIKMVGDAGAARSQIYMVSIFILCALSGYVPALFSWWPSWVTAITHTLLVIASWAYVLTNQVAKIKTVIQKQFNLDDKDGD